MRQSTVGIYTSIHLNAGIGFIPEHELKLPVINAEYESAESRESKTAAVLLWAGDDISIRMTSDQAREIADKLLQAVQEHELATNSLPEYCYASDYIDDTVVMIKRGESGYHEYMDGRIKGREHIDRLNAKIGVTKAQEQAMTAGSIFGWDTLGADPANYNEEGKPIRENLFDEKGSAK